MVSDRIQNTQPESRLRERIALIPSLVAASSEIVPFCLRLHDEPGEQRMQAIAIPAVAHATYAHLVDSMHRLRVRVFCLPFGMGREGQAG